MHSNYFFKFLFLLLCCVLGSCSRNKVIKNNLKVTIQEVNGKFSILKDGKIFNIRGASGYSNFAELKKNGGNTVRIWDTTHVDQILKEANDNNISVIVGLPIPESQYLSYYNNLSKVATDLKKLKSLINRIKSSPALLMWCVGNELVFPNNPSYHNFYKSFNTIVDMIHSDDPNHPVTTTMVNFQKNEILNIKLKTEVDVISFNIFSRITDLKEDLKNFSWFWDGPYLITEWGIDGPWQGHSHTVWDAKIEPTSTEKAKAYLTRYKRYMPVNDPRFLGSFIFFWGQKQEITHTWFSMFDEFGNKTEAVSSAAEIWTGKASDFKGPKVSKITLGNKIALENILLEPNKLQTAHIKILGDSSNLTVKWEIYPEDWFKKNNVNNLIRPHVLRGLVVGQSGTDMKFISPNTEGPYRLFSTVFDNKGNIATANIPFYVIKNEE